VKRWRWLCALALAGAVAAGSDFPGAVKAADNPPPLRLETAWLRVELDPASGAVIGLAADPSGGGDFSHPLAAPGGGGQYGIRPACRADDGLVAAARPGDDFALTAAGSGVGAIADGLRIGDALAARMEVSAAPGAPELTVRTTIVARDDATCQWAGLLLALDPALAPSTIYFAGRQGLASASPGRITVAAAPYAGAVCKDGAERTLVLTCRPAAGVEIEVAADRATIAASPHVTPPLPAVPGAPVILRKGETVTVEARLVFGPPRIAGLKPVTSKFLPQAQDFVLWTSHIATARFFGPRLLQQTAAVLAPPSADPAPGARRCHLRDIAHGWKSGMLVAGPDLLEIMSDEIRAFAANLDEAGHPPTSIGPDGDPAYGSLDSAGLLIGMIYDYLCRTGDLAFVRALLPAADRAGTAVIALLGPRDLPVIGDHDRTYPEGDFVKGEQTYLAAVCVDGLRKLARLHEMAGEAEAAGKWHAAANRIALAANRATDKGGLWDQERGCYIGWRNPDGSLRRDEDSFGNLWAVAGGLCSDGGRIRTIFARLNDNWQRYYLDGPCPTALSVTPYPGVLDQWAPWVGGWDLYVRARLGEPKARQVWQLLWADYEATDFPFSEASSAKQRGPPAFSRGRIWDSWGLLQAIYAGHYGIEMTPAHLRIVPRALVPIPADAVSGLCWRDATYDIALRGRGVHLARVALDGAELASCILPAAAGPHEVQITQTPAARKAFVVDAAPALALLGAAHRDQGIHIEGAVPAAGRYWMALQWPQTWGAMKVESVSGADFPHLSPLAGERAAVVFTVGREGKFSLILSAGVHPLVTPAGR
jgi:hypothetical protein